METMIEEWRNMPGYDEEYQVSSHGRVRNAKGHVLIPEETRGGYLRVDLCKRGQCIKKYIHRLVAMAFLPRFDVHEVVNHINGSKHDNRRENLEWMSSGDNTRHYYNRIESMEERNAAF